MTVMRTNLTRESTVSGGSVVVAVYRAPHAS